VIEGERVYKKNNRARIELPESRPGGQKLKKKSRRKSLPHTKKKEGEEGKDGEKKKNGGSGVLEEKKRARTAPMTWGEKALEKQKDLFRQLAKLGAKGNRGDGSKRSSLVQGGQGRCGQKETEKSLVAIKSPG